MRSISLPLAAALACVATPAMVHPDRSHAGEFDDAVHARQGYFQLVKANAGPLFGMAKGDVAYDPAMAQSFADNLSALAGMTTGMLWPEGSDKGSIPGETRALAAIWQDQAGFMEKNEGFAAAVAKVADAADDGLGALRAEIGGLGAACKACHDDYRADKF